MRGPVRVLLLISCAITLAIYLWLILSHFISEDAYGMHEMIRPQGKPLVAAFLYSLLSTTLLASIFLSDRRGAIEIEPHGFFDILSLITSRLAMLMIVALVTVMAYEVVARYVFTSPTLWANELSWWIGAFVFLFAGQYAMQQRSHIRIYVIYDMMPRWMQKTADTISVLLIVTFTFALVWGNYADAERRFLRMETAGNGVGSAHSGNDQAGHSYRHHPGHYSGRLQPDRRLEQGTRTSQPGGRDRRDRDREHPPDAGEVRNGIP